MRCSDTGWSQTRDLYSLHTSFEVGMRCSPVGATTGREGREHGHKTGRGPFSFSSVRGKGHEPCACLPLLRRHCIASMPRGSEPSPNTPGLRRPSSCCSRQSCIWRNGQRTRSARLERLPQLAPPRGRNRHHAISHNTRYGMHQHARGKTNALSCKHCNRQTIIRPGKLRQDVHDDPLACVLTGADGRSGA